MIKKIFSIAIVAISVLAAPMAASTNDKNSTKEACQVTEISKEKKDAYRQARMAERESKEFEGITLSDTQKKQLADLKEKNKSEMKKIKEASSSEIKRAKEISDKARELRKNKKIENRRAYLKEVKEIIGDDNYVVFLENQYVNNLQKPQKPPMQDRKAKNHGGKGRKFKKSGKESKDFFAGRSGKGNKNGQKRKMAK